MSAGRVAAGGLAWPLAEASTPTATPGTASPRPKVGLVLGGGGARGAAHIGIGRGRSGPTNAYLFIGTP